jgi:arginyl-tRNA synthetase
VQVDESKLEQTAEILGISSIKYFDLSRNRVPNYVFDFDRILDDEGNTGLYQLYAYVRILSILDKSKFGAPDVLAKTKQTGAFKITNPTERELALAVLRFPEQLDLAVSELKMNMLTDLVYDITTKYSTFYAASQVVNDP